MYGNGISIQLLSLPKYEKRPVCCIWPAFFLWVDPRDGIDLSTILLDVTVLTDTSGQSWCSKID